MAKTTSNIQAQVSALQNVKRFHRIPEGFEDIDTEFGNMRWQQYLTARVYDDWDLPSLIILAQLVRLEQQCEQMEATLADEGFTIASPAGHLKAHPLTNILNQNRIAAHRYLRGLGLSRALQNASSQREKAKKAHIARVDDSDVDDELLAQPPNMDDLAS